ncbi:hypothetical protein [Streptomyces huiliensis]|uniref:hypothetical protein n=1 Tax=Streptomyces huiliensis TaxID=2876027 RepID=UPI001CC00F01|nr:hypothetical protein [Streptomyces huiliensis]MBZ4319449.1 hypothetical protein [Streptomyces huiliensis]
MKRVHRCLVVALLTAFAVLGGVWPASAQAQGVGAAAAGAAQGVGQAVSRTVQGLGKALQGIGGGVAQGAAGILG